MSDVLEYIEYKLGASHSRIFELSQFDMVKTIKKITLPVFSKYYPHLLNHLVNAKTDKVPNNHDVYFLKVPDETKIFGVSKMLPLTVDISGRYSYRLSQNPIDNYIFNSIEGLVKTPLTFDFLPPNKIELYAKNTVYDKFLVQLKVQHPSHLKTIHQGYDEYFKDLALYDVAIGIKAIRYKFNNINTVFGSLELNTDLLDEAVLRIIKEKKYFLFNNKKSI
jgi:hypothetical protein